MRILRLLSTSLILEFIVMSAPLLYILKILIKFFLLANNFGTGKRIKLTWNESIIPKCHIIKPMAFLKEN